MRFATLDRRRFLRAMGLGAGASLLTPFLDRQIARAQGKATPSSTSEAKILITLGATFGWSVLGLRGEDDRPYRIYEPSGPRLSRKTLPRIFEPLAGPDRDWSQRMMIVSGLSRQDFGDFHGSTRLTTGAPHNRERPHASYDSLIAESLSRGFPYPVLSWRLGYHTKSKIQTYGADGKYTPTYKGPSGMYKELFSGFEEPNRDQRFQGRRAIMDGLSEDLKRARRRLAGPEVEALDAYEDSLGRLTRRLERNWKLMCDPPTLDERPEPDRKATISLPNTEWQQKCFADLALVAIQCGLTRVLAMSPITGQDKALRYGYVPYATERAKDSNNFHDGVCHSHHGVPNPTGLDAMITHHTFCARSLRYLLEGLAQIELDGKPADQSTIAVWHNHGGAWHHNVNEFVAAKNHVAVVIDGTGSIFETGRHHELPWDHSYHHAQFYQTIIEGVGRDSADFGHPKYARGAIFSLLRG